MNLDKVINPEQALTEAKTLLIRTFPFMAFIVISAKYTIVDPDDEQIQTMAATVAHGSPEILINPLFMMERLPTVQERTFVIAHEILHLYYHHLGRQRERGYHPRLWNVATDYFINYLLSDLESPNLVFPSFGLCDAKYAGMSSDEIYLKILEEGDDNVDLIMSQYGEPGYGMGGDGEEEDGTKGQPFDHVSEVELSPDQEANLQAALSASLSSGMMPGSLRNSALVNSLYELLQPSIPWRDVLRDYVVKSRDEFYTYKRYNSRSSGGIIFPSSDGDKINLLFGIDTSGSMSKDDLSEGLTELKAIVDEFQNWKVNFVTCEMDVEVVGEYSSDIGDDFTSFSQEFYCGGGTDMNPIIAYAEELDETPNAVVIVTDGYIPELMHSHVPVILVVVRNGIDNLKTIHEVVYIND